MQVMYIFVLWQTSSAATWGVNGVDESLASGGNHCPAVRNFKIGKRSLEEKRWFKKKKKKQQETHLWCRATLLSDWKHWDDWV